jgi:protease-4
VQEKPKDELFNFGGETGIPLETLVSRMDKAAKDSSVKAVVILLDQPTVGSAQIEELRQAISRLRGAGKEVIANADTIGSLGQYCLISAASSLSVVPTAGLWTTGLQGRLPDPRAEGERGLRGGRLRRGWEAGQGRARRLVDHRRPAGARFLQLHFQR